MEKIHQVILLDSSGYVHFSSETLLQLNDYKDKSLVNDNPFLESIFEQLLELKVESPSIHFSKMENPVPSLKGAYDFSFSRVKIQEGEFILWCIYDYSELYIKIKASQQKRNELMLNKEKSKPKNENK